MNFLRDNLYANRQRVELAGHVKYRRLQNEDNMTMKVKLKTGALFLLFNKCRPERNTSAVARFAVLCLASKSVPF